MTGGARQERLPPAGGERLGRRPAWRTLARSVVRCSCERSWLRSRILWRVRTELPAVALTFDDGPHPEHTSRILDILAAHGAVAHFFLVGQQARRHPDLVRRIVAGGHALGGHTDSHADLSRLGLRQAFRECARGREALEEIAGQPVRDLRPPWGRIRPALVPLLLAGGMRLVYWNRDSLDHRGEPPEVLLDRLRRAGPTPGDILLFHDDGINTVEALPAILDLLSARGLCCRSLDALTASPLAPVSPDRSQHASQSRLGTAESPD